MNPQQLVVHVATGYIASTALYLAARLDIASRLEGGSKSVAELAAATGVREDAQYRVLRLLVSLGIFTESAPGWIGENAASRLLRKDQPDSLHGIALFWPDPFHFHAYSALHATLKDGKPGVDHAFDMPLFDYLTAHPEYSAIFNDAMTTLSIPAIGAALGRTISPATARSWTSPAATGRCCCRSSRRTGKRMASSPKWTTSWRAR